MDTLSKEAGDYWRLVEDIPDPLIYILGFSCHSPGGLSDFRRSHVIASDAAAFHSSPTRQLHSKSVIQPHYSKHDQLAAKSYHEVIDEGDSSSVEREEDIDTSHPQPLKMTHLLQSWNPGSFTSYGVAAEITKTPDS